MYFFSNTYMQTNNNTKTTIKVRIVLLAAYLRFRSLFHLEINALLLGTSVV